MLNQLKKREHGFTIIEVMIVLAIAGMIMLIVFLAVPALQRSSRNTQRKNDVQNLLGAITTYENNNSGQLPTNYSELDWNPGYYTAGSGTQHWGGSGGGDSVTVLMGYTCNGNSPIRGAVRSVAVLWGLEQRNGGFQTQCTAS